MSNKKRLLVLLVLICFSSCKNEKKSTHDVRIFNKFYPPSNYKLMGALIDNKREGLWITYDSLGRIESEDTYIHGRHWGESRVFEDGYLAGSAKDTVIKGDTITAFFRYNSKGKTIVNGRLINGRKRGIWQYFRDDGKKVKRVENYTDSGMKLIFKDTVTKNLDF